MNLQISAPDNATLQAAYAAIRQQQYAGGALAVWNLVVADDGLSATLDTTSAVVPTNLPAAAVCTRIVPASVSDVQFFQALALLSIITQDEALAAAGSGAIPAVFAPGLAKLPPDEQFAVKMRLVGATSFGRNDQMTLDLLSAIGAPAAQADQVFLLAETL